MTAVNSRSSEACRTISQADHPTAKHSVAASAAVHAGDGRAVLRIAIPCIAVTAAVGRVAR